MKEWICTIAGIVGGFIATLFGGWDSALATLVVFMGIDFATGLVTAIMGKSKHSKSGALNSKAGWIGLAKKFCILLMGVPYPPVFKKAIDVLQTKVGRMEETTDKEESDHGNSET